MATNYIDIWKGIAPEDRTRAAEAFWSDTTLRNQQLSTMQLMSKRYNFRLKSLQALPAARKAKMLLEFPSLPPDIIVALLAALHLTHRKEMLTTFLDAAGIPHQNGVLSEEAEKSKPSDEKVQSAIEAIRSRFPENEVNTYLQVLYLQDPDYWSALKPVVA